MALALSARPSVSTSPDAVPSRRLATSAGEKRGLGWWRPPTFVALLLWSVLTTGAASVDPDRFFESTFGDFAEELQAARGQGKKAIMLYFEVDGCPHCARMRATVLNQVDVQDYYRARFLAFRVDIAGDLPIVDFSGRTLSEKEFAKRNRVWGTPTIAFYDLEGRQVVRYTGATSTKEEFLWLGEYAAKGLYNEMSFARYRRARRQQRVP